MTTRLKDAPSDVDLEGVAELVCAAIPRVDDHGGVVDVRGQVHHPPLVRERRLVHAVRGLSALDPWTASERSVGGRRKGCGRASARPVKGQWEGPVDGHSGRAEEGLWKGQCKAGEKGSDKVGDTARTHAGGRVDGLVQVVRDRIAERRACSSAARKGTVLTMKRRRNTHAKGSAVTGVKDVRDVVLRQCPAVLVHR